MNKFLLLIITLLYVNCCFAQTEVERKNKLTSWVTEKYHTIIEATKQVKQGQYQALYMRKIAIAAGRYTNDVKTGMWRFYGTRQNLLQTFNYDTHRLQYEAPEEDVSNFTYDIDTKFTPADTVTKPIRIGGRYYGYVPYLRLVKLPADIQLVDRPQRPVVLELLISPLGRLADYKIHIPIDEDDERVLTINPDMLSEEDRIFLPATFNREPISSRIFITCFVTNKGDIDM